MKKLYFGRFNWYGGTFELYRYARNENSAFHLMLVELSKELDVTRRRAHFYFMGKDNYRITEVKK